MKKRNTMSDAELTEFAQHKTRYTSDMSSHERKNAGHNMQLIEVVNGSCEWH